jgi:S-sulfo-L-cysteine synthase (3-phospho-L-serine-dependent)
MRNPAPAASIVDATCLPHLVRLDDHLFAAAFPLMKLLPAKFIVERAIEAGRIGPETTVIETSSGTFGLGLAMVCRLKRIRLALVSDPAVSPALQRRLEDLGARVEICREPAPTGGFQGARLARVEALRREHPDHYWPSQYGNPHNPGAYSALAELLLDRLGPVHTLVGSVGSGGSMCGTLGYLREMFPETRGVGVDTFGSVLFGQPDAGSRALRGLGNSVMPANLDHTAFDEVHWVSAAAAFTETRRLHRQAALFMGPTSGAATLVARWVARSRPGETVVAILPDEGFRYQDTVYDDAWMGAEGMWLDPLPAGPTEGQPATARGHWARFGWGRRSLADVLGPVRGGVDAS